jgi:hypothetical protein
VVPRPCLKGGRLTSSALIIAIGHIRFVLGPKPV